MRTHLAQRLPVVEPVKRLERGDEIEARLTESGPFRGARDPLDQRVRFRGFAHRLIRLDRAHVRAALGEQARRDPGTGAEVGREHVARIAEPLEQRVDRGRGIRWASRGVVRGPAGETLGEAHFLSAVASSSYRYVIVSIPPWNCERSNFSLGA